MSEKFDFATPEYIAFGEKFLQEAVAQRASEFADFKYTFGEIFTGVPEHLAKDGRLSWQMIYDNGRVSWKPGIPEHADKRVEMPYQMALSICHLTTAEIAKKFPQMMEGATAIPRLVLEAGSVLHDRMIPFTR